MSVARSAPAVPFSPPEIGRDEIAEVIATLQSGWLSTGPRVSRFEAAFGEFTGAAHAIALNSSLVVARALLEEASTSYAA